MQAQMMGWIMLAWKRWMYTRDRGLVMDLIMNFNGNLMILFLTDCGDFTAFEEPQVDFFRRGMFYHKLDAFAPGESCKICVFFMLDLN